MQKRKWKTVVVLRKVLTFAIAAIALMALLSVHVHVVFPPSGVTKLPTMVQLLILIFSFLFPPTSFVWDGAVASILYTNLAYSSIYFLGFGNFRSLYLCALFSVTIFPFKLLTKYPLFFLLLLFGFLRLPS